MTFCTFFMFNDFWNILSRYTLKRLQELHDLLISHIDTLGGNRELKNLIEMLHKDIQPMRNLGSMKINNGEQEGFFFATHFN